jgi:hypothetical protein
MGYFDKISKTDQINVFVLGCGSNKWHNLWYVDPICSHQYIHFTLCLLFHSLYVPIVVHTDIKGIYRDCVRIPPSILIKFCCFLHFLKRYKYMFELTHQRNLSKVILPIVQTKKLFIVKIFMYNAFKIIGFTRKSIGASQPVWQIQSMIILERFIRCKWNFVFVFLGISLHIKGIK